jgi:2-oxoisovalerate dehydrogenase E1 component
MTPDPPTAADAPCTSPNAAPGDAPPIPLGAIGRHGDGTDLAIVSYGNGYYLSRQAGKILAEEQGLDLRIIDLRWLAPLDEAAILEGVAGCARVLIVDECRRTGSQSEALMALFTERMPGTPCARITAADSFIPLGRAATLTLPSRDSIVAAALELAGREADRG